MTPEELRIALSRLVRTLETVETEASKLAIFLEDAEMDAANDTYNATQKLQDAIACLEQAKFAACP